MEKKLEYIKPTARQKAGFWTGTGLFISSIVGSFAVIWLIGILVGAVLLIRLIWEIIMLFV